MDDIIKNKLKDIHYKVLSDMYNIQNYLVEQIVDNDCEVNIEQDILTILGEIRNLSDCILNDIPLIGNQISV